MSTMTICDVCGERAFNFGPRVNVPFVSLAIVYQGKQWDVCSVCQKLPMIEVVSALRAVEKDGCGARDCAIQKRGEKP
jgi:hypothetical protein